MSDIVSSWRFSAEINCELNTKIIVRKYRSERILKWTITGFRTNWISLSYQAKAIRKQERDNEPLLEPAERFYLEVKIFSYFDSFKNIKQKRLNSIYKEIE